MRLKTEVLDQRVARVLAATAYHVTYKLGRGGYNAKQPNNPAWDDLYSDCSGYLSWGLMLKRKRSDTFWAKVLPWFNWIETTNIYRDATGPQKFFVRILTPVKGCVVVYPDRDGHEGHCGFVTKVGQGGMFEVADCKKVGITKNDGAPFRKHHGIFCVLRQDIETF